MPNQSFENSTKFVHKGLQDRQFDDSASSKIDVNKSEQNILLKELNRENSNLKIAGLGSSVFLENNNETLLTGGLGSCYALIVIGQKKRWGYKSWPKPLGWGRH